MRDGVSSPGICGSATLKFFSNTISKCQFLCTAKSVFTPFNINYKDVVPSVKICDLFVDIYQILAQARNI